jgi:hypothetical protein
VYLCLPAQRAQEVVQALVDACNRVTV